MTPVVAIVATYNERRFIGGFIDHCARHDVGVYVIDNESTDDTVAIARSYAGMGLVGIESLPRHGVFDLTAQLRRKSEVAADLGADWVIHADADERRLPSRSDRTLAAALTAAAADGYNAVNFIEYAFVPTREEPDHDHADFERTMRWYYPHLPRPRHRITAWRQGSAPVDLASSAGHAVWFDGIRVCPDDFAMRHYLYLSRAHAVEKYVGRGYVAEELALGWHQARSEVRPSDLTLLAQSELRRYIDDGTLDPSRPRGSHPLFDPVIARLFPGD